MTNMMPCQTAQEQLQQLLDDRCLQEMPRELQSHLAECAACAPWQALFPTTSAQPTLVELPANFAQRVVQRHTQEQRRQRWFRSSSWLAIAASLVMAGVVWVLLPPVTPAKTVAAGETTQERSIKLYQNLKNDLDSIQARVAQLSPPRFEVPTTLTQWELEDTIDPVAISMPALRTIGSTVQSAFEPYEAPARETMKKVRAWIDDPELKRFMDNVKKRAM